MVNVCIFFLYKIENQAEKEDIFFKCKNIYFQQNEISTLMHNVFYIVICNFEQDF